MISKDNLKNEKMRMKKFLLILLLVSLFVTYSLPELFENVYASPGHAKITIKWLDSGETLIESHDLTINKEDDDWHQIYEKITPPPGARYARILLDTQEGYDAYFDDIGLIGSGYRRSTCIASSVCDEIDPSQVYSPGWDPGDLPSCDKIGYTYFQDSCSDCLVKDNDNVCRSSGSLGQNDGCTAPEQCNDRVAETIWYEGNIMKNCDSTCTFSQWCDASCPDWNGNLICNALEPGSGCCSGCYYTDITGPNKIPDGEVNMRDIALAAKAFGSTPGNERWEPDADINGDGEINMKDIARVSRKFGKIC